MTTSDPIAGRGLGTLRTAVTGDVVAPGDRGHDEARRAWNLAAGERPAVVVTAGPGRRRGARGPVRGVPGDADRPAGHRSRFPGPLGPLRDAMLLRAAPMRGVRVGPAARAARAGAGAVGQDVTVPAAAPGLAALAGTSPDAGVTGDTRGGGRGWLARRDGLAAGSVTAAEVVTPDGRRTRAGAGREPDLPRAVRGGGGRAAVVTALARRLSPVRDLSAGALSVPVQRTAGVLPAWRARAGTVPDQVTSPGRIRRLPPLPRVPGPLRGRAVTLAEAAYLGDAAAGTALIRPLRRPGPDPGTVAMIPAPARQHLHMDPGQPVPAQGDGAFLTGFPAAAIDALTAVAGPAAGTPPASIEIRHLGGAPARPAPGGGAQATIDASHAMFAAGFTPTPELAAAVREHAQAAKDALAPWHASYDYYNFAETSASASAVLPPASYHRLQKIKATYDPGQAIIAAHPVWPARH